MRRRGQPIRGADTGGMTTASFPGLRALLLWISIVAILFVFGCSSASWKQSAGIIGGNQSGVVRSRFAKPLVAKDTDASYDPVSAGIVTFNAPSSGASASLSSTTGTTVSGGTASVTTTANGIASSTPHTASATVTGVNTRATFSLNNAAAATLRGTPSALLATINAGNAPAHAGGSGSGGNEPAVERRG